MNPNHQLRWQPLLGQWVVISADTSERPWSGATVSGATGVAAEHDPDCYLCPRVTRANGKRNTDYKGTLAFDNDFASLTDTALEHGAMEQAGDPLRRCSPASGLCRVLCWSERHNVTLAQLSPAEMLNVVKLWKHEYQSISQKDNIAHVLIFENKGTEIGVSNLHPHGQVYASAFLTDTALRMRNSQTDYGEKHKQSMLQALLDRPEYTEELIVEEGLHFKTIVPYAARFAFETWIVPTRHVGSIDKLSDTELTELSGLYQRQTQRYDRLFQRSSPNITLLHNSPCDGDPRNEHWCFHIAMQPPLRDLTRLKYLAGYESGANNIVNPVQPENAARKLRECSIDRSTH